MKSYAGIGSRQITEDERTTIEKLSKMLSSKFIVYSGNAEGSDIAFQTGSNGNCVLILPWKNFNRDKYDHSKSIAKYDCGDTPEGNDSIDKFHPFPDKLSRGAKRMMCRNYHQIHGYDIYQRVSFVVACANTDNKGKIIGGTGQACRIAESLNIPIVNIRKEGWKEELTEIVRGILE